MDLKGRHYTWFQNRECEYFPCHNDESYAYISAKLREEGLFPEEK